MILIKETQLAFESIIRPLIGKSYSMVHVYDTNRGKT